MPSRMQEPFIDELCEACHLGTYQEPENGQDWHVKCGECGAVRMVYEPMPHQQAFHEDPHKYRLFAGGFGSAKTTTACMEAIDHIMNTPGGAFLIGAESLPQLEQTAQKEFFEIFPEEFIVYRSKQKNYIDTINGHRVIFRPLDDEQKARSLTLSGFWVEEANGVDFSYFTQLQTRLRSPATKNHIGILSSNPDMNHIKTEFLLKADEIHNAQDKIPQNEDEINTDISVHIAPTHLNTHLPETFYEDTARGKPDWWIRRYLNGSFENKEGLVYPMYEEHIVPDFEIPAHWKRRIGADFGLNNPTGVAFAATDPETGITFVYDEHKESHKPVSYHANKILERLNEMPYGIIETIVGDAAGQQKTAGDLSSVFDHYAEYGVYFQPSTKKLEDSIMKMYSYFDSGKLKIFESCTETIQELSGYHYPERKLDKETKNEDTYEKPIAKNDHLLDGVRYLVAELPENPEFLINRSYNANHVIFNIDRKQTTIPHALQEDNTPSSYSRSDAWLSF